jgi:hypothetical protein
MIMNNLRIGPRLAIGFGAVLLLLVVIVAIAYWQLARTSGGLTELTNLEQRAGIARDWAGKTQLNVARAIAIAKASGQPDVDQFFTPQIKRTTAEISAGVTPVNYAYPPGNVLRYGVNTTPGTTDMTGAINTAADICRQGKYTLILPPETCLVSSSLNFSGIHVRGDHLEQGPHIKASSAQFDVITSTGNSTFSDFYVDGGWDESTAGQSGDAFSLKNSGGSGFAYVINFHRVSIARAKKRGIYWEKGGYGTLFRVECNSCGLHGIELWGNTAANSTTTIWIGGNSIFTSTPNGYGAKLTDCILVRFDGVIMEATSGIQINGNDNRSLSLSAVYQEFGSGSYFIDYGSSGGIGCSVIGCVGGGKAISDPTNWQNLHCFGNSLLAEPAIPLANGILQADGGELLTSTTGGVDVTATSLSIPTGTWIIHATVQTVTSTATTLTQAACQLTTSSGASGLNNSTTTLAEGAAQANYNPGAALDQRLNCFRLFRTTTTQTMYLRTHIVFSGAGNLAYHGMITAVKLL